MCWYFMYERKATRHILIIEECCKKTYSILSFRLRSLTIECSYRDDNVTYVSSIYFHLTDPKRETSICFHNVFVYCLELLI
jgi:hypothetical protein